MAQCVSVCPIDIVTLSKRGLPQVLTNIDNLVYQLLELIEHIQRCRTTSGCTRIMLLYSSHELIQSQPSCGRHQGLVLELQCSGCCTLFTVNTLATFRGESTIGVKQESNTPMSDAFKRTNSALSQSSHYFSPLYNSTVVCNPEQNNSATQPESFVDSVQHMSSAQSPLCPTQRSFDHNPHEQSFINQMENSMANYPQIIATKPNLDMEPINEKKSSVTKSISCASSGANYKPELVGSTNALNSLAQMFTPIVTLTSTAKSKKRKKLTRHSDKVEDCNVYRREDIPFENVICKCRYQCWMVSEADRRRQYDLFRSLNSWNAQSALLKASLVEMPVRNHRKTPEERQRSKNILYYLGRRQVCRAVFLSTYGISSSRIAYLINRKSRNSDSVSPDRRGRHAPSNKTSPEVQASIREFLANFPGGIRKFIPQTGASAENRHTVSSFDPQLTVGKLHRMYVEANPNYKVSRFVFGKVYLLFINSGEINCSES